MKKCFAAARLLVAFTSGLCVLLSVSARAAVFTTDTVIGIGDTNFDGMDIVISNGTVTVDGAHSFSNLLVGPGGVLTHTFSTNGLITFVQTNASEPQVLTGTDAVTLLDSGLLLAIA